MDRTIPGKGLRFDGDKLLVDPYALAVANTENYQRAAALRPGDNAAQALKCAVIDTRLYDWEGDAPLKRPFADALIYEMHVAGFTRNPNSGLPVHVRGTYAGLIAKLPYLKELEPLSFELPAVEAGRVWRRLVDTSLVSPDDLCEPPRALLAYQSQYLSGARSSVVLIEGPPG